MKKNEILLVSTNILPTLTALAHQIIKRTHSSNVTIEGDAICPKCVSDGEWMNVYGVGWHANDIIQKCLMIGDNFK